MRNNVAYKAVAEDDWRARDDARTLKSYMEVKNDPERLRKAQSVIAQELESSKAALGIPTPPPTPGRCNPATIMKLSNNKNC